MPQAASENQQPGGNIILHFLPCRLNFNRREPFLKHGEIERVAQFESVKGGKRQGAGLALRQTSAFAELASVE